MGIHPGIVERVLIIFLGVGAVTGSLLGQGGHYWTNQYGAKSTLLGNSVIGSVGDLGAVYYNPSRLAGLSKPEFILSADVYEWNRYQFSDALNTSSDVSESDFGSVPGFIAGSFAIKSLPGHSFAYSALSRLRTEFDLTYFEEITDDLYPGIPGDETIGTSLRLKYRVKNQWYNVSWAYQFENGINIGVTMAGSRIKSERLNDLNLQALDVAGNVSTYRYNREFEFTQYGFFWKFGVSGQRQKLNWGATITTPFLKIAGNGDYYYQQFYSTYEMQNEDYFATSRQEGIPARYKTPWSLGAGISHPFNDLTVHFSSEWFAGISTYNIMTAEDHYSQSHGDTISFALFDAPKSVVNFGLGLEYFLNDGLQLYARFNTDFSATDGNSTAFSETEQVVNQLAFGSNLYHYGGGVVLSFKTADITLGFTHTGSVQEFDTGVRLVDGSGNPVFSSTGSPQLKWSRWQLLVGFSFNFLSDSFDLN